MGLRDRKRINNTHQLERFNTGLDSIVANKNYDSLDMYGNQKYTTPVQQNFSQRIAKPITQPSPVTNNNGIIDYGEGGGSNGVRTSTTSDGISSTRQIGSMLGQSGNNTAGKIGAGINGVSSIVGSVIGQDKAVPSEDMMLTEAGHSNSSVMGVNFTQQNGVDESRYNKEADLNGVGSTLSATASGAAAGATIGGPWGAVIGGAVGLVSGIFGWSSARNKLKKRIWNSQQLAQRTNTFNRSSAMSTGLSNQYYNQNGNTTDDVLYANRGKDANYKFLKRPKYE